MNTLEFITMSMTASREMSLMLINDLRDEPVAQPTRNGGNHAIWILGHLAYMESVMIHQMIQGKGSCTLARYKELFDADGDPSTNPDHYPTIDELISSYDQARAETQSYLESCTPESIESPALGCPEAWQPHFGTIAQCLDFIAHHPSLHFGQLADIRRSLGRKPILG